MSVTWPKIVTHLGKRVFLMIGTKQEESKISVQNIYQQKILKLSLPFK